MTVFLSIGFSAVVQLLCASWWGNSEMESGKFCKSICRMVQKVDAKEKQLETDVTKGIY